MHFFSKLAGLFRPHAEPTTAPAAETQSSPVTATKIMMDPPANRPPRGPVLPDDSDRWWRRPPADAKDVPEFDALNNEDVLSDLGVRIAKGELALPEIPQNIIRIMQIMNDPDFRYEQVAALVQQSPMLAGDCLKIVNSAAYTGQGGDIADLTVALPRLGKRNITSMLYLYSSQHGVAGNPALDDVAQQIVTHSKAVAVVARYLGHRFFPDPDIAFFAGLLHDIGKVALLKEFVDNYDLPETETSLTEDSFDMIFPALHCSIGAQIAADWSVTESVAGAIEHHHDYLECGFTEETQLTFQLSALVSLSDTIARMLGRGRHIGPVDFFLLPAAQELNMALDHATMEFLDPIEEMVHAVTT